MTKAEIVQALYDRVGGFSKKEAADAVDLVFDLVKETLGKAEKVKISGFGKFTLRDKRQRTGRNPQTGEPMPIRERRVLTFRVSEILKRTLNPDAGEPETNGIAKTSEARVQDPRRESPLRDSVAAVDARNAGSGKPDVESGPQRSA